MRNVVRVALLALLMGAACSHAEDTSYSESALDASRNLHRLKTEADLMKARADVAEAYSRMNKIGVYVDESGQVSDTPPAGSYVATFGVPEVPRAAGPQAPGVALDPSLAAPSAPVDTTPRLQSISGDRAYFQIPGQGIVQARIGETLPGGYKLVSLDNGAVLERGGAKVVANIEWELPEADKAKEEALVAPRRR